MSRTRVSPPTWLQGFGIDDLAAGLAVQGVISQDWLHERYERRETAFASETEDLAVAVRGYDPARPRVISRPCFVRDVVTEAGPDGPIPVMLRLRIAGASGIGTPEIDCFARLPKRVWSYGNAPKVGDFTKHSGVDGRCMDPLCDFDPEVERQFGRRSTCRCRGGGFTFRMLPKPESDL